MSPGAELGAPTGARRHAPARSEQKGGRANPAAEGVELIALFTRDDFAGSGTG